MFALLLLLLLIIITAIFIHQRSIAEFFVGEYPYTVSLRNTKNMSYDIRGDIPPTYTFTGPWLQSDIYNPAYTRYNEDWLGGDFNNYDNGYQYIRPNGTPLFM